MKQKYDAETVTRVLTAVVAHNGKIEEAKRSLGLEMPSATIKGWMDSVHAHQYREILLETGRMREQTVAGMARQIALEAAEGEREAIAAARGRLARNQDPDPGKTASHLSRVKAQNIEKVLQLEGRPTVISERIELKATLNALEAKGVIQRVRATDVEVVTPQSLPASDD